MIRKHVREYQISHSLKSDKGYMKVFPSTRDKYMLDFVKPSLRENPCHLIIQVDEKKKQEQVAKPFFELPLSVKSNTYDVTPPNITERIFIRYNMIKQL